MDRIHRIMHHHHHLLHLLLVLHLSSTKLFPRYCSYVFWKLRLFIYLFLKKIVGMPTTTTNNSSSTIGITPNKPNALIKKSTSTTSNDSTISKSTQTNAATNEANDVVQQQQLLELQLELGYDFVAESNSKQKLVDVTYIHCVCFVLFKLNKIIQFAR